MSISSNRYSQFKDYLNQLLNLSGTGGLPSISQKTVGEHLDVDSSGVSKFLSGTVASPKKMITHFQQKYPSEYGRWPEGSHLIGRILQVADGWFFLNRQPPGRPAPAPVSLRPGMMISGIPSPQPSKVPFFLPPPPLSAPSAAPLRQPNILAPSAQPSLTPLAASSSKPANLNSLPLLSVAPLSLPKTLAPPARPSLTPSLASSSRSLGLQPLPLPSLAPAAGPSRSALAPLPLPAQPALLRGEQARATFNARARSCPKAPMAISYRGHQSEKDADGMVFDHIRLQTIAQIATQALMTNKEGPKEQSKGLFLRALRNHTAKLPFGVDSPEGIRHPAFVEDAVDAGLLVIPGRAHAVENEPIRLDHEYRMIRGALNRGQPILGICAGSWRIWEQLRMWTENPNCMAHRLEWMANWHATHQSLVDVSDHGYNGGMIRLDQMGVRAIYNVELHKAVLAEGSLLKSALKTQQTQIRVNSVHWKAVNPNRRPLNIQVSALSASDPTIQKKSRQGEVMKPEVNTVEAFESVLGSPIFGIQWHPEGYNDQDPGGRAHGNLLKYMAKAGTAYAAKRRMLRELPRRDDL